MNPLAGRDEKPHRFARFLAIVRERWWAVLFTMIIVGGLAFGVSLLLHPKYSATSQLVYSASDAQLASQALSSSGGAAQIHNISSDALTLETSTFAGRVSQAMGGSPGPSDLRSSVDVTSDSAVQVIEVTAKGADAYQVAEIANTYATEFVKQREEEAQKSLSEAQSLLEARIEALSPTEATSAPGIALKQRLDDIALLLSMQVKDYKVLQQADVPTSPYFPRPFLNLLLGLCAGLVLGLISAAVLDYFDRRIKDQATLERVMDLPVLGSMPSAARKRGKTSGGVNPAVGFRAGNEALLESMRMLRSNLKVLGFGDTKRSVLVTSTAPGEGKSTLAVNLALGMALSGDRVILVDADLRSPRVHEYLDIPNDEGLGDALLERDGSWSTKIQAVDLAPFVAPEMSFTRKPAGKDAPISKFLCLTSGPVLGDPTEILESNALGDMLSELQGISDYVILDGPPMLVTSDSLILAQSVDAVVFASTLGKETAGEAVQVRQLLARAEIQALGIVICGSKPHTRDAYYYYRPRQDGGVPLRRGS